MLSWFSHRFPFWSFPDEKRVCSYTHSFHDYSSRHQLFELNNKENQIHQNWNGSFVTFVIPLLWLKLSWVQWSFPEDSLLHPIQQRSFIIALVPVELSVFPVHTGSLSVNQMLFSLMKGGDVVCNTSHYWWSPSGSEHLALGVLTEMLIVVKYKTNKNDNPGFWHTRLRFYTKELYTYQHCLSWCYATWSNL